MPCNNEPPVVMAEIPPRDFGSFYRATVIPLRRYLARIVRTRVTVRYVTRATPIRTAADSEAGGRRKVMRVNVLSAIDGSDVSGTHAALQVGSFWPPAWSP